jgi:hypothetical protein
MNLHLPLALSTVVLAAFAWTARAQEPTTKPPEPEPRVGVRFEGYLPGTRDEKLQGEFDVDFRIYLSPQGGDAVWSESQRVKVVDGRMDIVLGATKPISMAIHEATFKFLGASVGGGREVYPRFTIVNTVFASAEEALRPVATDAKATPRSSKPARTAVYGSPGALVATRTEKPSTWKQALLAARAAGADLPDYADWYGALAKCSKDEVLARTDHYEWCLPWVYDTASHGEYNRLFRGRFQGCEYSDLAPTNAYVFRFATPAPVEVKKGSNGSDKH